MEYFIDDADRFKLLYICIETTRDCSLSKAGDPCGPLGDDSIFCNGIEVCDDFGNCTSSTG